VTRRPWPEQVLSGASSWVPSPIAIGCDDRPRGMARATAGNAVIIGGPEGNVTLCLDLPEEVFRAHEQEEGTRPLTPEELEHFTEKEPEGMEYVRTGYAIILASGRRLM